MLLQDYVEHDDKITFYMIRQHVKTSGRYTHSLWSQKLFSSRVFHESPEKTKWPIQPAGIFMSPCCAAIGAVWQTPEVWAPLGARASVRFNKDLFCRFSRLSIYLFLYTFFWCFNLGLDDGKQNIHPSITAQCLSSHQRGRSRMHLRGKWLDLMGGV